MPHPHPINLLAVLMAAFSSFLLGAIWYSPAMFGPRWCREAGIKPKEKGGHPKRVFGFSFFFALVSAGAFRLWLGPAPPLPACIMGGILAGLFIVGASFGINYQFAERSFTLWLIDGGYHAVQFLLYGIIIGVWR